MRKERSAKNPEDSEAFSRVGRLGGEARAKKLSAKRRSEIARMGGLARWRRKKT